MSQIANVLKSASPENPIPPEYGPVERIFHAGQSQQGGSMVTYATAFHFDVNDGYFVQAASSARPINFRTACSESGAPPYPNCTPRLTGDARRVRTDLPVPVYRALTETDVSGAGGSTRQDDTETFRYYEMPGTAHVTVHKDVEILPPLPILGFPDGLLLEEACDLPLNTLADGPVFGSYLYNAMWKNMELQSRYGVQPPHGDLIEVVDGAIQRDEFDNALGGIRLSMMDVPIATYGPNNVISPSIPPPPDGLLGLFCVLSGTRADFDTATLDELYPSHRKYVGKVTFSTFHLFFHRFILWEDVSKVIREAQESDIGMLPPGGHHHCGIGFELVLLLPPLMWLQKRRRRAA